MAGQFTRLQKTYRIDDAEGVALYHGVVLTSEGRCGKPTDDNMVPLGVCDNDERVHDGPGAGGDQTGKQIAVKLEGIASIVLSDAVTAGDRIILATGGTAIGMPDAPGQYNVLGFAEKDGVSGDVIPVRMAYHVYTIA